MDLNVKLIPNLGKPYPDTGRYRRLVGKLNYLTMTMPDISFPVSVISQFLTHHVIAIGMQFFGSYDTSKNYRERGLLIWTGTTLIFLDLQM